MAIGISTACFYPLETELALAKTGELGADCVEIFINSPHELDKPYIDRFAEIQKQYGLRVKSFHTYASFTESYYYFSSYERRFQESLAEFRRYFDGMHTLGATLLVMHGAKIPGSIPDEQVFERFGILQQLAHKDVGGAVEMIRENVDHSAEIDLKHKIFLRHMFRLLDFDDLICALYHILPQKATVSR